MTCSVLFPAEDGDPTTQSRGCLMGDAPLSASSNALLPWEGKMLCPLPATLCSDPSLSSIVPATVLE
ncbi:MAG: hypothetical protein U1U88_000685 [Lawsonella clevelandensis]